MSWSFEEMHIAHGRSKRPYACFEGKTRQGLKILEEVTRDKD